MDRNLYPKPLRVNEIIACNVVKVSCNFPYPKISKDVQKIIVNVKELKFVFFIFQTLKMRKNQVERGDLSQIEKTTTGCLSTKKSVKLVDPKKSSEAKIAEYKNTETEQQRRERLQKKGITLVRYDDDFF